MPKELIVHTVVKNNPGDQMQSDGMNVLRGSSIESGTGVENVRRDVRREPLWDTPEDKCAAASGWIGVSCGRESHCSLLLTMCRRAVHSSLMSRNIRGALGEAVVI